MSTEQYNAVAEPILAKAHEAGQDLHSDEVKMELVLARIPFSAINSTIKSIAIEKGWMIDPKEISANINTIIESFADDLPELEGGEWGDVQKVVESIVGQVEGATPARVTTLLRNYCADELEFTLPKKPRTGGGGRGVGKIARAVVEFLSANQNPTKEEFYTALIPVVSGDQQHANIIYYMNLYMPVGVAIASGKSIDEVVKEMAAQPNPTPPEGVNAEPRGSKGAASEDEEDEEEAEEEDF